MIKQAVLGCAVVFVVLMAAGLAQAELTVDIISTQPTDGSIGEGETAKVFWRIESDGSGTFSLEIGGDGTEGSGDSVAASDGTGSFTGTLTSSTTISADNDFGEGDGSYTIYVIATSGTETAYASTAISLDTPPDRVSGLSVGRGDGKLFLSWDPVDASDLSYYLVYYGTSSGVDAFDYDGIDASEGVSPIDVDNVDEFQLSGLENEKTYYVRVSAVDESGTEGELSEEGGGTPTETVGFSELSGDEGGCFIATAAWGDYDHPLVVELRLFRDHVLAHSSVGRALVQAYYRASPPLARRLASHPGARAAVRTLLTPVAAAAGLEARRPGLALLPLLMGLSLAFVMLRRRGVSR
ncbi:MAG: fibronectin type III domain-containing protein [Candidatus Lernaella stagnicola]|nr:fibronectin type III domain-containing protein [Candidatus Lernaella stagnicola]